MARSRALNAGAGSDFEVSFAILLPANSPKISVTVVGKSNAELITKPVYIPELEAHRPTACYR
jgi:hypothetical protein